MVEYSLSMKDSNYFTISSFPKLLFLLAATFNGWLGFYSIKQSYSVPIIYKKDFLQDYLMAKAILNGVNPYFPVRELAQIWLSDATSYNQITHPSLHPTLVGLLCLPLSLLSYQQASVVWLAFESVCMLTALILIFRGFGKPIKPAVALVFLFISLGFGPVEDELWSGQLNTLLLLLMVGSWLALRDGKDGIGGALLGGVIAFKWMAWPIVLYLIIRRKWKSVIIAATSVGVSNLLALLVLGYEGLKDYYLKIVPSASYIRYNESNLSASAFGFHLFAEYGWYRKLMPLWSSPKLAVISSYLITLAILSIGLRMAIRASSFDTAFGLLTGLSILASPVAWSHYLVLAAIPFAILLNRLSKLGFPRPYLVLLFFIVLPLLLRNETYYGILHLFSTQKTDEGFPIIQFMPGLFLMLPTVSLIGLLWFIRRLDRVELLSHSD